MPHVDFAELAHLVLEDTRVGRASVSQPYRSALCLCLIHACVTRLILRKLSKRTTCQRVLAKSVLRAGMGKDLVKARRRLAVGLTNTRAQVSMVSLVPSGKRLIHPTWLPVNRFRGAAASQKAGPIYAPT